MVVEKGIIDCILEKYRHDNRLISTILFDIKHKVGKLSRDDLKYVTESLNISLEDITIFLEKNKLLGMRRDGKYIIELCSGETCKKKSNALLKELENQLKIESGETTEDLRFSIKHKNCLGSCTYSPILRINGKIYQNIETKKIKEILEYYR